MNIIIGKEDSKEEEKEDRKEESLGQGDLNKILEWSKKDEQHVEFREP